MYQKIKKLILAIQTPKKFRIDFWKSFENNIFSEQKPLPWMNYNAIDHIENHIKKGALVFEYGSGSSTRYWISMGCKVTSVEHDKEFYRAMHHVLADKCDYRLVEPELDPIINMKSHELAENYKSSDFDGYNFENYAKAIDVYPDNYFDLVVVDGRARPACIKHAVSKIRSGGILVLDNSDRDYYLKNTRYLLDGWQQTTYRATVRGLLHKEQTTIFHKP